MTRKTILTLATAVLLTAGTAATTAQAAPPPTSTAPSWTSATLPVSDTVLTGAAQPDARTTWAAGFRITQVGKVSVHTPVLLSRRAGDPRGWVSAPTAALPDGAQTRFNAVTATSAGDGWVVGDDSPEAGGIVTEQWNGTSWTLAAAPVPAATYADSAGLLSVSGRGSGDAWAVGWAQIEDGTVPNPKDGLPSVQTHMEGLAEHWNGTAWTVLCLPEIPGGFTLDAVTETGPSDVWAGGYTSDDQPLLLHYDGHGWKRVPGPRYDGVAGEFNAVAGSGPDDVWAVGRTVRDDSDQGHALVAHWDGRSWRQVAVPEEAGRLSAVTVTPQGVVATGRVSTAVFPGPGADGYAMRLSGGTWRSLALPSGTLFDPTGVVVSPLRQTTLVGLVADPDRSETQPMVLTSGG